LVRTRGDNQTAAKVATASDATANTIHIRECPEGGTARRESTGVGSSSPLPEPEVWIAPFWLADCSAWLSLSPPHRLTRTSEGATARVDRNTWSGPFDESVPQDEPSMRDSLSARKARPLLPTCVTHSPHLSPRGERDRLFNCRRKVSGGLEPGADIVEKRSWVEKVQ
jgi:hypothetical protein